MMSTYRCRMLDRADSEKLVECEDASVAPDCYVHQNVNSTLGAVSFVEVEARPGQWLLWEVQCISAEARSASYMTRQISLDEARRILRRKVAS